MMVWLFVATTFFLITFVLIQLLPMKEIDLSAVNLSIGYANSTNRKGKVLYQNLNFNLYKGELACLIGSNGAGKSTLLRTLNGTQKPLSGSVYLRDKDLSAYTEQDLSVVLGLVLTDRINAGGLTVRELVGLGRYPYTGFFGRLSADDCLAVDRAMDDTGILHKATSYVAELSDGERQKALIAKALAQECPLVLLDEPTAFLDAVSRIEIMNLLHNLASRKGKTILLSTHDIELALSLADRLWLLSREKGMYTGVPEDIVCQGILDDYLGNKDICFDTYTGSFNPKRNHDKKVMLVAEEPFRRWTSNLLNRSEYVVTESSEGALFEVRVIAANQIEVVEGNQKKNITSFESLSDFLRIKSEEV